MKTVEPKVFLIGETRVVEDGLQKYLQHIGAPEWQSDAPSDVERLIETYGRLCYRSWKPGMNPNVTRVRKENKEYIGNILRVRHGSVIEHPVLNFIFADVSRVFTHELVRHRAGVAISQESLRFVRLDTIPMWLPAIVQEDADVTTLYSNVVGELEKLQRVLAEKYKLDDEGVPFHRKKTVTSAMRRVAPDGVATTIGWSVNPRALRHIIEMRTDPSAEEEIRLVFGKVAEIVIQRYPNLFGDYAAEIVDGYSWYKTPNTKV